MQQAEGFARGAQPIGSARGFENPFAIERDERIEVPSLFHAREQCGGIFLRLENTRLHQRDGARCAESGQSRFARRSEAHRG